ncbi:MAG: hypothetical protein RMJ38_07105 [candidate division WOR-3 bacterium]|nr:hypothetical protein [candidate division WOR-3 bacterium]MDW8151188.1 hypothetical protein [candidate division WOR-3 bacterium]
MRLLGWSFILSPVFVGYIIMPFAFFSIWKEKKNLLFIITGILGVFLVIFSLTILALSFSLHYKTGSISSHSMNDYTLFLIGFLTFLLVLL